jgi:hypothetical protein
MAEELIGNIYIILIHFYKDILEVITYETHTLLWGHIVFLTLYTWGQFTEDNIG